MQLGFCSNMLAWAGDTTGLGYLEQIRDAGFDYLEAPAAQLLALSPPGTEAMIERVLASGLPCRAFNNLFQPQIRLTGDRVDDRQVDDYFARALAAAAKLKVEIVVLGSSAARNLPMGFPPEKAWGQMVAMLRRFGPRLEEAGVTLVIEHLNHLEGNFLDSFTDGLRLAEEVGHPQVQGFVDFYHLDLGNERIELVDRHFPRIRHCHFSNVLNRGIPTRERHEKRLVEFLELLRKRGYPHLLSVEGFPAGEDASLLIPRAAEFIRSHID
ncbi:MAG: sugar phosphate isomerase/epimerase [Planctomycetota bacterium]|jgi:sugar phosphate isomerase/epimerase|nr:sugar phosphate isomerase/epimerase [Planctomycetota bacterium]